MATQRKPTPGPWAVFDTHPKKSCFYIDRHDQVGEHAIGEVAVIYTTTDETKRANAALIAAAPDLYTALRELREAWCLNFCDAASPGEEMNHLPECYEARAALRKADGNE